MYLLLVAGLIYFFFWRVQQNLQEKNEKQSERLKSMEKEFSELQSQLKTKEMELQQLKSQMLEMEKEGDVSCQYIPKLLFKRK